MYTSRSSYSKLSKLSICRAPASSYVQHSKCNIQRFEKMIHFYKKFERITLYYRQHRKLPPIYRSRHISTSGWTKMSLKLAQLSHMRDVMYHIPSTGTYTVRRLRDLHIVYIPDTSREAALLSLCQLLSVIGYCRKYVT